MVENIIILFLRYVFHCLVFHFQDMTQYQAKCQELQATEMNLRSQISLYTDKYDEFQNALTRSNEVFGGFKGEMEKVSRTFCVFLQFACCAFKKLVYSNDHRYMFQKVTMYMHSGTFPVMCACLCIMISKTVRLLSARNVSFYSAAFI